MGKELKDANDNVHHHFSYYQEQKMLTIYTNELKHTRGKTESFLLETVHRAHRQYFFEMNIFIIEYKAKGPFVWKSYENSMDYLFEAIKRLAVHTHTSLSFSFLIHYSISLQ